MDTSVAPISTEQRLSNRLIAPYLRDACGVGIVGSHHVYVPPIKPISPDDTSYEFELPVLGSNLIDLKNILLSLEGQVKKRNDTGDYVKLPDREMCTLVSNTLHTLFSSVTVVIGNNQVNKALFCVVYAMFRSRVLFSFLV